MNRTDEQILNSIPGRLSRRALRDLLYQVKKQDDFLFQLSHGDQFYAGTVREVRDQLFRESEADEDVVKYVASSFVSTHPNVRGLGQVRCAARLGLLHGPDWDAPSVPSPNARFGRRKLVSSTEDQLPKGWKIYQVEEPDVFIAKDSKRAIRFQSGSTNRGLQQLIALVRETGK